MTPSLSKRVQIYASKANGFLVGPNSTRSENLITYAVAAIGMAGVGIAFSWAEDFTIWRLILICVLAFDLFGGATANATNAARRWWHRPGTRPRNLLGFVVFHVHPIILGLCYDGFPVLFGIFGYAILCSAALLTVLVPQPIVRPAAYGLCSLAILATSLASELAWYLQWFMPVLFMKLLLSHLLPDGAKPLSRDGQAPG